MPTPPPCNDEPPPFPELAVELLPLLREIFETALDARALAEARAAITLPPAAAIALNPDGSIHMIGLFIVNTNRFAAWCIAALLLCMLWIFQNGSGCVKRPVLGLKDRALK